MEAEGVLEEEECSGHLEQMIWIALAFFPEKICRSCQAQTPVYAITTLLEPSESQVEAFLI